MNNKSTKVTKILSRIAALALALIIIGGNFPDPRLYRGPKGNNQLGLTKSIAQLPGQGNP